MLRTCSLAQILLTQRSSWNLLKASFCVSEPKRSSRLWINATQEGGTHSRRFFTRSYPPLSSKTKIEVQQQHLVAPNPTTPAAHILKPHSVCASRLSEESEIGDGAIHLTDFTPPSDFTVTEPLLNVLTATHRAAGTTVNPHVRIFGAQGLVDLVLNGNFARGSSSLFSLGACIGSLGEIDWIEVTHPSSHPLDRWLLEKITISWPGGKVFDFVCRQWIGSVTLHDDDDETVHEKVVLYPSEPGETEPEEELFEWDDTDDILKLSLGRSAVPADEKIKFGYKSVVRKNNGYAGEDAFFVSQGSATEKRKEKGIHSEMSYTFSPSDYLPPCYYLGVADGVGMWRTHGVDSGIYSRHLLHSAREVISVHENPEPFLVLRSAWEKTTIVDGIKGSCTVCLIRVRPDGWADGVQVGDAGLALVRGGKVVFRTSEQEHLFGFPYQLGHISSTKPEDCIHLRFRVCPGDVIVMGSDGLFDNVSDKAISRTVTEHLVSKPDKLPERYLNAPEHTRPPPWKTTFNGDDLSRKLVTMAYLNSVDKIKDTPWSRAAQKEWDVPVSGGKEDDIAVVVAQVEIH